MKKRCVQLIIVGVLVLSIVLVMLLSGAKGANEMVSKVRGIKIDMMYDTALYVPNEYAANLVHEQENNGAVTTDVFYMQIGETKTGIYRFDFGSQEAGDWLGILKTAEGDVIVTYTVFAIPEESLSDQDEKATEIYYALMNSFNDAVHRICADSRYIERKEFDLGEDQQANMTYWNVTLRGGMSWTETTEADTYKATFYGTIRDEKVELYTVYIGNVEADAVLGMYDVNGVKKPVSIETYELNQNGTWADEEYSAANRMMDTINDVINVIMQSKQFSAELE